jgi:hypothetical protein
VATIEQSLVTLVAATAPITALIGSSPMRFYPLRKAQGAANPAMAYQRISTPERVMSHQGRSHLAITRFQITTWATSASSHSAMQVALVGLLGYRGTPAGGVRIDAILPAGDHEEFEPTSQEYMRYFDIFITHQED